MTLNIICAKWGNQYTDEYVENLYKGCYDKFSYDFRFFCISDNTSPIKGVELRDPIGKSWNSSVRMFEAAKIHYFQKNFLGVDGHFLSLDLDMIIMDEIELYYQKPTIIYKYWRSDKWFSERRHEERTMLNSSMMYWKQNSMVDYYNEFMKDEDYWLQQCDATDNYHQFYGGYDWEYFDEFAVYSYDQGSRYDKTPGIHRPGYTACIFNGEAPAVHACDNWVKDYWSS